MAYDLLEPFGQPRNDQAARATLAMLYNAHRGDGAVIEPDAFLPVFDPDAAAREAMTLEQRLIQTFEGLGG